MHRTKYHKDNLTLTLTLIINTEVHECVKLYYYF